MILAKEDIEKAVSWWAGKLIDNIYGIWMM